MTFNGANVESEVISIFISAFILFGLHGRDKTWEISVLQAVLAVIVGGAVDANGRNRVYVDDGMMEADIDVMRTEQDVHVSAALN